RVEVLLVPDRPDTVDSVGFRVEDPPILERRVCHGIILGTELRVLSVRDLATKHEVAVPDLCVDEVVVLRVQRGIGAHGLRRAIGHRRTEAGRREVKETCCYRATRHARSTMCGYWDQRRSRPTWLTELGWWQEFRK